MEDFKIITIENNESYVTIDTLVKFSGNAETAIKSSVLKYEVELGGFGLRNCKEKANFLKIKKGRHKGNMDWSTVRFNEDQATFLLSLMQNTPEVVRFKVNLVKEFRRLKDSKSQQTMLTPIQHMEIANQMLVAENIQYEKKLAQNKRMIASMNIIESSTHDTGTTIPIEEFCKIVTDVIEGAKLGRTKCYTILRSMDFVMMKVNRPTQRGIERKYVDYVEHGGRYSTVLYINKANGLIKLMVKHLQDNDILNEALGYPFHPELRD